MTPAAHFMHGSICLQLGEHRAAVPSLTAALAKDPSNWQAATNLASAYLKLLDDDATAGAKAVQFARRAVELHPTLEAARLIQVNALRSAALDAGPAGSAARLTLLREAAEWRKNKLASSEYDETTWAARTWTSFTSQRISVAAQLAMAQEAAEALGMSVAADPRGQ